MGSEQSRAERIEEILVAARTVLARFGFRKTTLEDIADQAGVSRPTIYYYFSNKEEILSTVIRKESELLLEAISDEVGRAGTAAEKLAAFVKSRCRYLGGLKTLYSVTGDVVREVLRLADEERARFLEAELALLVSILEVGVETGEFSLPDVELVALVLMAGLRGLDETFLTYGKLDRLDEGLDGLINAVIYGFAAH